ncbi:hypothetical protein [Marinomonas sp. TW1]|nr:hypothetical protein [Marinomonas sp. TW1]
MHYERFEDIYQRAAQRHGGERALEQRLSRPLSSKRTGFVIARK